MFYPEGEEHASLFHGTGTHTFEIQLSLDQLENARQGSGALADPCDFDTGLPIWLGIRAYNEFRDMDAMAPLAIEGLVLELLAHTSRRFVDPTKRRPPRWLRQVRELLQAQFIDELSLDDLAQAAGVHPVHLARAFRQQYHCTVGEYIRELRMECAQRQLSTSEVSIAEIAASVGFSDQSHLCKALKRHTGLTPTQFRKNFGLR